MRSKSSVDGGLSWVGLVGWSWRVFFFFLSFGLGFLWMVLCGLRVESGLELMERGFLTISLRILTKICAMVYDL
jgi:hypothetical protein